MGGNIIGVHVITVGMIDCVAISGTVIVGGTVVSGGVTVCGMVKAFDMIAVQVFKISRLVIKRRFIWFWPR